MPIPEACPGCGQTIEAAGTGGDWFCAACGAGMKLDPAGKPGLPRAPDETFSRSMLVRLPEFATGPRGEMIARLTAGSLLWLEASGPLASFLGRTAGELAAEAFLDSLHPDDRALAEDEFRQAVAQGERHDFVLRLRGADGEWHFLRIHTQARYEADGRVNHIRCHLKDVTDRVRSEEELRRRTGQLTAANEQLREANRRLKDAQAQLVHSEKLAALGTMAAGLAHEVNNPLSFAANNVAVFERDLAAVMEILSGYREGLDVLRAARPSLAARIEGLESEADLPYLRKALPELLRSTRRGLARVGTIVQTLRDFAQVDRAAGGSIDVACSLDQAVAMLGQEIAGQQVRVERHSAPAPTIECAAADINQVLLGLLMNALQAIESAGRGSGTLRVVSRPDDGGVAVEVGDDGCGIPPENLTRIFDPFFTTRPAGRGTGLGLSLAHRIVADHGGRIEVESRRGAGSTFRVFLPLRVEKSGGETGRWSADRRVRP
ncbi:MAG TPA: ATP-binding protein [Isosphaeraceae bacterium]|jgi:PAS domain S-box-containing protein